MFVSFQNKSMRIDDVSLRTSAYEPHFEGDRFEAVMQTTIDRIMTGFSDALGSPAHYLASKLSQMGMLVTEIPKPPTRSGGFADDLVNDSNITEAEWITTDSVVSWDNSPDKLGKIARLTHIGFRRKEIRELAGVAALSDTLSEAAKEDFELAVESRQILRGLPQPLQKEFHQNAQMRLREDFLAIDPKCEQKLRESGDRLVSARKLGTVRDAIVVRFRTHVGHQLREVLAHIHETPLKLIESGIDDVVHPAEAEVVEHAKELGMQDIGEARFGAGYDPVTKRMYLGEPDNDLMGIIAHQFGHVIDQWSNSVEWATLWQKEIRQGMGLSQYARLDPREGFAEFARVLWTKDPLLARVSTPGCWDFWERLELL